MKGLAIYTAIIGIFFAISAIYYAVVGDNAPLWTIIFFLSVPIVVFASLYLYKDFGKRKGG